MKRTFLVAGVACLAICPLLRSEDVERKRSFVGKKLPDIPFVDTEGHTVRAGQYLGSVLVMITGIPW